MEFIIYITYKFIKFSKMACPICDTTYNDHVEAQRCYNICATEGYSVCKSCMNGLSSRNMSCPSCRGPIRTNVMTRVNNVEQSDPMDVEERSAPMSNQQIILLIDISSSMGGQSGTKEGAPLRVELAVHMAKVMLAFCRKLKIKCVLYTFSEAVTKIPIDEETSSVAANQILEDIYPSGSTYLGLALKKLFDLHGDRSKYFVFTDGDSTDEYKESVSKFVNTQLHLIA